MKRLRRKPLRVDYLVGGPRISLGATSNTPGARTHITSFVEALRLRGAEVRLYLASSAPGMRRFTHIAQSDYAGATGRRVWLADFVRIAILLWTGLVLWARTLCRPRPDVIYERLAILQYQTFFHARRRKAFRIVEANGILHRETAQDRNVLKLVGTARWLEAHVLRHADLVVAISDNLKQELCAFAKVPPDRVLVVPNGVGARLLEIQSDDPTSFTIGFVGSLSGWQRLDLFLDAVAQQRDDLIRAAGGRALRVDIVGDGAEAARLRELSGRLGLDDIVTFAGRMSHADALLRAASWSVGIAGHQKSSSETMYHSPLKLYEYAGLGLDIVCTPSADATLLAASGVRCYFYEDEIDLPAALLSAARAPQMGAQERDVVRTQVLADHGWTRRVQDVLDRASVPPRGQAPQIVVQQSLNPPDGTTKFVDQLAEGAPPEVRLRYFSWPSALLGRYDVFHMHWAEYRLRGSGASGGAKKLLFAMLLARLRLTRTPLVRTAHNPTPHEPGKKVERALLTWADRQTALVIALNPTTAPIGDAPLVTILHGHYIDRFDGYVKAEPQAGRLLYVGIIRPYKGLGQLLDCFEQTEDDRISLRVVGAPRDEALAARVAEAVSSDHRVSADMRFVSDEQLVAEVTAAELVVLAYTDIHNSGIALVALSLARPILVPMTASTAALAAEVGADWVICFDGPLTSGVLEDALNQVQGPGRSSAPDLAGRDWAAIGLQHRDAYRSVLS